MKRLLRLSPLGLALAAVVLSATGSSAQTTGGRDSQSRLTPRLDAQLSTLAGTTVEPQRVIVRVRPGARAALRQSLSSHNDLILAEHDSLDAITAVVHAEDLALLAARSDVLSISADAVVRPHDLIGGLVGLVGGVVKTLASVFLPNGADTTGPAVLPSVLRSTLGVNNSTWSGKGVGVAIIDSGLEMSSEFSGRMKVFYDFTHGGITASSA